MCGELDLFVPPFRGAVVAGDQSHPVQMAEVAVHERVPCLPVNTCGSMRSCCQNRHLLRYGWAYRFVSARRRSLQFVAAIIRAICSVFRFPAARRSLFARTFNLQGRVMVVSYPDGLPETV